ncbi:MAG: AAA family ATPase [Leptospiraceae bacterium]|nr:AAA family ATPase [Leptospiraceae bacterium]MCP5495888.1 AAA family ATPase [Leptospiraceae bacterium]
MKWKEFEIVKTIFESDTTVIHRAIDTEGNYTIIKHLKNEFPRPKEILKLKKEYNIVNSIREEGVIKPIKLVDDNRNFAILFQDIGGESLTNLLKENKLPIEKLLSIAIKITESLVVIHKHGIIHKDIKPHNIIVNPQTFQLEIADFGISTLLSRETPSIEKIENIEGTLPYISPEQTGRMNRNIDYRTDFYSLGITFYEMFTGKLPYFSYDILEIIYFHIALQVAPPDEINPEIPLPLCRLILKLLEKNAENRYKSALGIQHDLLQIYELYTNNPERLSEYTIAQKDVSDKFAIPQKLYGRENEIANILQALERVVSNEPGRSELLVVKGFSGVGKTNLVKEIQKPVLERKGFFLSGKYEQFKRDVPYYGIVQAFEELNTLLLVEPESKIKEWKNSIQRAVGNNGQVITDVIPGLALLIGKQNSLLNLNLTETQNRFILVLKDFIKVFATKEHPLVIFLDDMHWVDSASVKLLEALISDSNIKYILFIFSYRDNEVNHNHSLPQLLNDIKNSGCPIQTIHLLPLAFEDVNKLIADILQKDQDHVYELTDVILSKTRGNPFFVIEFLKSMYNDKIIYYNSIENSWSWDIARSDSLGITDNVIDLMIKKIRNLSDSAGNLIRLASCISNRFDLNTLSIIHQKSILDTASELDELLKEGLIVPEGISYQFVANDSDASRHIHYNFLHDKVLQAAYETIPDGDKENIQLLIGRHLWENTLESELDDRVIDIVNHYNIGRRLIDDEKEKRKLIELNLKAAKKSKESIAYYSCYEHLYVCIELLPDNSWETMYSITFQVYKFLMEIEYMVNGLTGNDSISQEVLAKVKTNLEKAEIYNILISKYMIQGKNTEVLGMGKIALSLLGIEIPEKDIKSSIVKELTNIKTLLKGKSISSLLELSEMHDLQATMAMKVLINLNAPAYLANPQLYGWILSKMVNLSIQHGNTSESAKGYASFGNVWIASFKDYQGGYEFGLLGLRLSEKLNDAKQKCQACFSLSFFLSHWVNHLDHSIQWEKDGFLSGLECGDIPYAGYTLTVRSLNSFFRTKDMEHFLNELFEFLTFCKSYRHVPSMNAITAVSIVVSQLVGKNLSGSLYKEDEFVASLRSNKNYMQLCIYYTLKGILCIVLENHNEGLGHLQEAKSLHAYAVNLIIIAEYYFYHSLAILSTLDNLSKEAQETFIREVEENQVFLKQFADNCNENFLHQYYLIEAELATLYGLTSKALNLYEKSIKLAGKNGFIMNEAMANERLARYFLSMVMEKAAKTYIQDARYLYQQLEANTKVNKMNEEYSNLLKYCFKSETEQSYYQTLQSYDNSSSEKEFEFLSNFNTTRVKHLDLNSIFQASRSLSREIVLENLLKKLMKFLIQNAGAENGMFIYNEEGKFVVEAIGKREKEIEVMNSIPLETYDKISHSIVNFTKRTEKVIVLDNASIDGQFGNDPYISRNGIKSVICLPVANKGKLLGLIYLENNITEGAFTVDRIEALQILASQTAISLENAKLYSSIENMTRQRTRIQTEFEIAEKIQTSLIPKKPVIEGYEIAPYMKTAERVGGDYYDVINQEDREWLVIGDVSGHGVSAGLVMIMAQTAIHTVVEFQKELNPKEVLQEVNKIITANIQKMNTNKFMTILLIQKIGDTFYYSGQHLDIIVYRAKTGMVEKIVSNDCWLGLYYMINDFSVNQFTIETGDAIILYTDGITEAMDQNDQMFDSIGLINLMKNHGKKSVEEIKNMLLESLQNYRQKDDITFMILKKL